MVGRECKPVSLEAHGEELDVSNIITAEVSFEGTRPLLWHRFGENAIPVDGRKEREGVAGNDPGDWKRTVTMTEDRQLYLEGAQVFGCIRDAAKHTKRGKSSVQSLVAATLLVLDDVILVGRTVPEDPPRNAGAPVYLDVRGVTNPSTRARNVRYRIAASAPWQVTFRIQWDRTIVSRAEMEAVLRDAGQLTGIGNGRSIGFGRFELGGFEVVEN